MAAPKPKPPALHVVASQADEIARQLTALGATRTTLDDRVYDELVRSWRDDNRSPRQVDMAVRFGVGETTIHTTLRRLVAAGRVYRLARGEWLPKVV